MPAHKSATTQKPVHWFGKELLEVKEEAQGNDQNIPKDN